MEDPRAHTRWFVVVDPEQLAREAEQDEEDEDAGPARSLPASP